jgi:putative ABC transport system substrate-binding protein
MRRRDILRALATTAAWPALAHAQGPTLRRLGILMGARGANDPEGQERIAVVRNELRALGWEEGRNLHIELRWAAGDQARIEAHAQELIRLAPDVILANSTAAVAALARATRTIPIIVAQIVDPVGLGFVESLARPGGNITGFTVVDLDLVAKWVDILKEAVPSVQRTALLFNPASTPYYVGFLRKLEGSRRPGAVSVTAAPVQTAAEIEPAIAAVAREPGGGLIVPPNPFIGANRKLVAEAAQKHRLPSVGVSRDYAIAGGLISYGPDFDDIIRRSTHYVDRVLKGASPADLPVQAPTRYGLVVNLRAAQTMGLEVAPSLLARADEVIE